MMDKRLENRPPGRNAGDDLHVGTPNALVVSECLVSQRGPDGADTMNDRQQQTQMAIEQTPDQERVRRLRGALTETSLQNENVLYAQTRGISENNGLCGFRPGYLNLASGEVLPSCFASGAPAPVHLLEGLPESWVLERDSDGRVVSTRPGIIAGFILDGRFYTREEAIKAAH